jgi:hypothetical protein
VQHEQHACIYIYIPAQIEISARGSASLISLIPEEVLEMYDGYNLQDIELNTILKAENPGNVKSLDYYACVKDAAKDAPRHCDGKSASSRMIVQVIRVSFAYSCYDML